MKLHSQMPMYYGAKPELFEFAKRMRHEPTPAEKIMWAVLTQQEFEQYKFRRQHPIARFIADFYSHSLLLVIELDGGYHLQTQQKELDIIRDEDMQQMGLTILRFTNEEILQQQNFAINKISETITRLNAR